MRFIKKIAAKILFTKGMSTDVGTKNEASRYAWMEKTLLKIPEGYKILDAGAGELKFKKYCSHLEYVSQDFAQYDGVGNRQGLQTKEWDNSKLDIKSDITEIPVEARSFDAVMCNEVLEHVPDPVAALKELDRVLKPKGYLILTAPFCSLTHFAPFHFSTGFSRFFYEKYLEEFGYEILDINPNGNYFEYLAQELRRLPGIGAKYAHKQIDQTQKKAIKYVLDILDDMSKADKASNELLCFGYQVFAQKK